MKQVIRNKTFETNSSSIHTLCIMKEEEHTKDLDELRYHIGFGEYGWEKEEYTTYIDMLEYLWTMVHCGHVGNEYVKLMQEWLPNCTFEEPGIDSYGEGDSAHSYYDFDGYIDHGSEWFEPLTDWKTGEIKEPSAIEEIFSSKESFADVVFNSHLYTWNDNDSYCGAEDDKFLKPDGAIKVFWKGN